MHGSGSTHSKRKNRSSPSPQPPAAKRQKTAEAAVGGKQRSNVHDNDAIKNMSYVQKKTLLV